MKVLIFGQNGQVARCLAETQPQGVEATYLSHSDANLENPAACAAAVHAHAPDVVINAAAYTAVDAAEDDSARAHMVNGTTPGFIAAAAADIGAVMLQISTDYVFDGSGSAPRPSDAPTAPLNVYGASKRAGELAVISAGGVYGILRTSWVFSQHGSNFVKTMQRLGEDRDALNIVADQIGGPTPATAIAEALWQMATALKHGAISGIYHFSGTPDVSWADFARAIFAASRQTIAVTDILTSAYPTPAKRPLNSRLDCTGLKTGFGIKRPEWAAALPEVLGVTTEE